MRRFMILQLILLATCLLLAAGWWLDHHRLTEDAESQRVEILRLRTFELPQSATPLELNSPRMIDGPIEFKSIPPKLELNPLQPLETKPQKVK